MASADNVICGLCTVVNSFAIPALAIGAGIGGIVAIGDPHRLSEVGRGAALGFGFGMVAGIAALVAHNAEQLRLLRQQSPAMGAPYPAAV